MPQIDPLELIDWQKLLADTADETAREFARLELIDWQKLLADTE
jgi:hypothetical protein